MYYDLYQVEREMAISGIHWFRFNNVSGNAIDSKGTSLGAIVNATRVTGVSGNAMSFTGTGSYIQFNSRILPVGEMSVRLKVKTTGTTQTRIFATTSGTSSGFILTYYGNSPQKNIGLYFRSSSNGATVMIPASIGDGQWHDILITWDGTTSANGLKVYVDDLNTPVFNGSAPHLVPNHSYNLVMAGDAVTPTILNFPGQIDELEVYNKIINPFSYKTFFLENGEYKTLENGEWNIISSTKPTFTEFQNRGINYLNTVTDSQIKLLTQDFEVITWSNKSVNLNLKVINTPESELVYANSDISLVGVEYIESIKLVSTGNTKIAISFDRGITWKAYENNRWTIITDAENGMTNLELNNLTSSQIEEGRDGSAHVRFSYYLQGSAEVDNIEMRVALGGYEKLAESTDYIMNYDENTNIIKYTVKKSGSFSVNYVDA